MATSILKKLFPRIQFLEISRDASQFNKVFENVIEEINPDNHNTIFIGLHNSSGTRFFIGYIYGTKKYGACLTLQYDGTCRVQFLNNEVVTSKNLG